MPLCMACEKSQITSLQTAIRIVTQIRTQTKIPDIVPSKAADLDSRLIRLFQGHWLTFQVHNERAEGRFVSLARASWANLSWESEVLFIAHSSVESLAAGEGEAGDSYDKIRPFGMQNTSWHIFNPSDGMEMGVPVLDATTQAVPNDIC